MDNKKWRFPNFALFCLIPLFAVQLLNGQTSIEKLRVQNSDVPLAIEESRPLFSWIMNSAEKGQKQTAYQIIVTRESDNRVVWNSGKTGSGASNNIKYLGVALQPETAYSWEVTVWDSKGTPITERSRFETGIMNPAQYAWEGAEFIGSKERSLDAASSMLFELNTDFRIVRGSAASVILGANDFRMNDKFQNLENVAGENYIRFEIDISGVGTDKGAALNIYRVGYGKGDSPTKPYYTLSAEQFPESNINELITPANKNSLHNLSITVDAGDITVKIDNTTLTTSKPTSPQQGRSGGGGFGGFGRGNTGAARISVSNYSTGNNFNTFPNLCEIGFAANPGDVAEFTDYVIKMIGQTSTEYSVVFGATTTTNYNIFTRLQGISVNGNKITVNNNTNKVMVGYTDPSYGANTMLRTTFSSAEGKTITKAKLYVTSMGSYEMYIHGERVGDDWFLPATASLGRHCAITPMTLRMLKNGANAMGRSQLGLVHGLYDIYPSNFNFLGILRPCFPNWS